MRNLGSPVFPKRLFRALLDAFDKECQILTVWHRDRMVAGVLTLFYEDQVLPYYGGALREALPLAVNDFMYWELMCHAARAGYRTFDFGRSRAGTGAYDFKRHWGFEPVPLPYQYVLLGELSMPNVSPSNPRVHLAVEAWKRLPLPVAKFLGPPSDEVPAVNILMLGRWLPVGRRGAGHREYDFGRHLAGEHQRDGRVHHRRRRRRYGPVDPSGMCSEISSLRSSPWVEVPLRGAQHGHRRFVHPRLLPHPRPCSARLADRMKAAAYDLVYVSSSSMIQYALELGPTCPLSWTSATWISEWWRRQADLRSFPGANFYRTESTRLRQAEAAAASRASACIVASAAAAEVSRALPPGRR